jgi:hypothetical protein
MKLLVPILHLIVVEGEKMNSQSKYRLGDLIVALFEEARVITTDRGEQTVLVYAALKDLLQGKVRPAHPIALKVGARMTGGH